MTSTDNAPLPKVSDELAAFRFWFEAMILTDQPVSETIRRIGLETISGLEGMAAAQDQELAIFRELMTDSQAERIIVEFGDGGSGRVQ